MAREKMAPEALRENLREAPDDRIEATSEEARQGLKGSDVLAVLAVSTFLAAVGLITFFITATMSAT
jgi:hypothetical protein